MRFLQLAAALAICTGAAGCAGMITGGPLVSDPDGPTGQIVIQNRSRQDINVVLLSRCSASSYGLNRLPRDMAIPSGGEYAFTVSPGCWDASVGRTGYGDVRHRFPAVPANGSASFAVTGGAEP
ncbi:MAG TPA: hypothetical protein VF665_18560 [Longimicrobium sp.]|jgi:hypothetical protein|uniref:hypothetical protein n=1 Tax=Longimicrobium sp. TaxID=2029185 RepID=UPI002ED982CC